MPVTPHYAAAPTVHGINLIGHVTGAMGLGVAARNTLDVLSALGRPFIALDIDPGGGRQGAEMAWREAIASPPHAPYPINWFQLNPPEIARLAGERPVWLDLVSRTNVCVPFWELPRLPVAGCWAECLEAMDLVLAPSMFVLDAIRRSAPSARVAHYPQTVVLPEGVGARRADFGLPRDAVLFHVAADVSSDLERKNPLGAIQAFCAEFPKGGDTGLVVKLSHRKAGYRWADATDVLAAASGRPNVIVVDQDFSYADALSLAASCDVCVSLHRAEGLGLGMLEAMALGKPVIATSWSGNMDFTTADTSCLVGFDLVPVRARHPAYHPRMVGSCQVWAEPRIHEARVWMRTLAHDARLRTEIGGRARQAALSLQERVMSGEVLREVDRASNAPCDARQREQRRHRLAGLATPAERGDMRSRIRDAMQRLTGRTRG